MTTAGDVPHTLTEGTMREGGNDESFPPDEREPGSWKPGNKISQDHIVIVIDFVIVYVT